MDLLGSQPRGKKSPFNVMWLIAFTLAGMLAYAGISRSLGGKEIIPWRDDFAAAQTEAKQTGKPMFVYFTADWCGPCQSMKRTTWADVEVERALQKYVTTRVDIDLHPELATSYQIESVPTFILLSESGDFLRANSEGAIDAETLVDWLNSSSTNR